MTLPAATHAAIEAALRDRLAGIPILRVDAEESHDHDGDPVLFIRAVHDAPAATLGGARLAGLTRHLRTRLQAEGEARFPHTRPISRTDFEVPLP